jgi:AcrR family transcriptional regulator
MQRAPASRTTQHSPHPQVRLSLSERRRQLIDAARRVFAEHGFRGATTRQIAAEAGVTEALIFQHFPDKDALYAAILDEEASEPHTDRWLAELEQFGADGDDAAVIRTLYLGIITRHDKDPDLLRLMMFSALEGHPLARHVQSRSERLYRFLERFINEGQNRGRFRAGEPGVLARATLALPVYHVLQRHLLKMPWPAVHTADVIETGAAFTLAGLRRGSLDTPDILLARSGEVRS